MTFLTIRFLENMSHERSFANQQNTTQISNPLSILNCFLYGGRSFINNVTSPS